MSNVNWDTVRWWVETTLTIVDKKGREVPFILNAIQNKFHKMASFVEDVILKARKEGMSAIISAYFLIACVLFKNQRAVIISFNEEETKKLFRRVKRWVECLRKIGFPINTEIENKGELTFPNTGSWFYCGVAGTKAFGKGTDISLLHLTELPSWRNQQDLSAVLEARRDDCVTFIESTAGNAGDKFHKLFNDARFDRNTWNDIFFTWFDNPEYSVELIDKKGFDKALPDEYRKSMKKYHLSLEQIGWKVAKIGREKRLINQYIKTRVPSMEDPSLFPREYPENPDEAFFSSGRHIFDTERVTQMQEHQEKPRHTGYVEQVSGEFRFQPKREEPLQIFKTPKPGHMYLIAGDVAEGVRDGAYNDFIVGDLEDWEEVAYYHNRIDPLSYADVMARTGYYYNIAWLAPEINNPGHGTVSRLYDTNYPKLWIDPKNDAKKTKHYTDYGYRTTDRQKSFMIARLRKAILNLDFVVHDENTLTQLLSYVEKDGKFLVEGGFCDSVIALGIWVDVAVSMNLNPPSNIQQRVHDPDLTKRMRHYGHAGQIQFEHGLV